MALEAQPARGHFPFNERKATAAAAFLLQQEGGTMDYMRLVKLLYLAERESLAHLGHPLTGDTYCALDQGPILSRIVDLCKQPSSGVWGTQVERSSLWAVRLKTTPDLGPLSPAEMTILEEVAKAHRDHDQWQLSTLMQGLPEWRDPRGARVEIAPTDILAALGKTPDQIREILVEADDDARVDALLRE
ncbi:MAG TPA: Panacea domain-containing protein [Candidatus Acidoferrum sp.]|nr:Panacea domain-containing protein [Candidatus Acidoferrum sp.]